MKRISILLGCVAVLAGASAALAAGHSAKLKLGRTGLGKIVVNGRGSTLYMFTRDARNKDNCLKVSGCAAVWPPLTSAGRPVAGPGIRRALIGTIRLPSGARQVTYAGHPLYMYIADSGPGDTSYVGFSEFGGSWYALNASGRAVK
jgi:predicted lipoprotein with Yx(FWY)xxD motif